jgi:hypothetical protein
MEGTLSMRRLAIKQQKREVELALRLSELCDSAGAHGGASGVSGGATGASVAASAEGGAAAPAIVDGSAAAAGADDHWASRIRAEAKELASVSFGECLLFTVAELYGCRADEYLGLHTSVRMPSDGPRMAPLIASLIRWADCPYHILVVPLSVLECPRSASECP